MKNFVVLLAMCAMATSCGGGLNGDTGLKGDAGANGNDGLSLVVDVVVQTVGIITCNRTDIFQDTNRDGVYSTGDAYQNGFLTCDGAVGAAGADGQDGVDGEDGSDGINGTNGLNADLTYSVVSIFDPCGASGGYDEVILKLGNGKYIASFSDNASGNNTRLVMLAAGGSYITTDGTNCHFTLP
jgi:hypothetical protein